MNEYRTYALECYFEDQQASWSISIDTGKRMVVLDKKFYLIPDLNVLNLVAQSDLSSAERYKDSNL